MKLKNKFALASIVLILVSTLFLAVFFFRYISNQIKETEYSNSSDMSVQVSNYFDEKFRSMFQRVFALRSNDVFNNNSFIAKFLLSEDSYYHAAALTQLSGVFSEIRMSEPFINSVYIYTPKGDFYDLARLKRPGFDFKSTKLYSEISSKPDFNIFWGEETKNEMYQDGKEIIPLVLPLTVEGYSQNCYLIINFDVEEINKYLQSVYSKGGSNIVILDNQNLLLMSYFDNINPKIITDSSLINQISTSPKGITNVKYMNDQYITAYSSTTAVPWKILIIKSSRYLTRNLDNVKFYIVVITCVNILLCFAIALLVSKSITKPLSLLERTIEKVTKRDFTVKFNYKYNDEVGHLGGSFNFMLDEISELISKLNLTINDLHKEKEKVREEQQLKRKAELKALQSQINPHFLYNTLNSIIWLADSVNAKDISLVAAKLGKFFQISLNRGLEFLTLKDELDQVSSYLFIQKIRYGDKLNFKINVDDEIMNKMTIKLILQPFVENSIYHGIKELNRPGNIEITGKLSEDRRCIELYVIDDGSGIETKHLNLINNELERGTYAEQEGYGIYNVNERIKLYFGDEYGVQFTSEPDVFTKVKIIIPVLNYEDVKNYVQTYNS